MKTVERPPSTTQTSRWRQLWHNLTTPELAPEQILAEFYRYRRLVWCLYALSFFVALYWAKTVLPSGWLAFWLSGLIAVFGGVGYIGRQQMRQGRRFAKTLPKSTPQPDSQKLSLAACLLIIFALGLIFILLLNWGRIQWRVWDSVIYDENALSIAGKGFTPDPLRPSGYSVLVAFFHTIFGQDCYDQLFFFQAVLNALNGVLVFGLAVLLTGKRAVAWTGGLLCAFCPFTAGFTAAILTETPAIFLFTATIFLAVLVVKRPSVVLYYALLGSSAVFLLEVRFNFQLYLLIPFVLALFFSYGSIKKRLLYVAIVLGIIGLVHGPVVIANSQYYGRLVTFTRVENLPLKLYHSSHFDHDHWFTAYADYEAVQKLLQQYPKVSDYELCSVMIAEPCSDQRFQEGLASVNAFNQAYLQEYGWNFAGRVARHLWEVWPQHYIYAYSFPLPDYLSYGFFTSNLSRLYLVFFLTGLFFFWRVRSSWLVLLSIAYLWLLQAIFWVEPRYMLPVYPVMLMIAGLGLVTIWTKARQWWQNRTAKTEPAQKFGRAWLIAPLASLVIVATLSSLFITDTYQNTYSLQLTATSFFLNNNPSDSYFMHGLPELETSLQKMSAMPEAQIPSNCGTLHSQLARIALRQKNFSQTISSATTALTCQPQNWEAYLWRSKAYSALNQPSLAAADLTTAKRLSPQELMIDGLTD